MATGLPRAPCAHVGCGQLETVLLKALRGAHLSKLRGMDWRGEGPCPTVRPLLQASRRRRLCKQPIHPIRQRQVGGVGYAIEMRSSKQPIHPIRQRQVGDVGMLRIGPPGRACRSAFGSSPRRLGRHGCPTPFPGGPVASRRFQRLRDGFWSVARGSPLGSAGAQGRTGVVFGPQRRKVVRGVHDKMHCIFELHVNTRVRAHTYPRTQPAVLLQYEIVRPL